MKFVWQTQLDFSQSDHEECAECCARCAIAAIRKHLVAEPSEQARVDFFSDAEWLTTDDDTIQALCECDDCGEAIGDVDDATPVVCYRPNLLFRLQPLGEVEAGAWLPHVDEEAITLCDRCAPSTIEGTAAQLFDTNPDKLFSVFVLLASDCCSKCGDGLN